MALPTSTQGTSDDFLNILALDEDILTGQSESTASSAHFSSFDFPDLTSSHSVPSSFDSSNTYNEPNSFAPFDCGLFESYYGHNAVQQEPSLVGSWTDAIDAFAALRPVPDQLYGFTTAGTDIGPEVGLGYAVPNPPAFLNSAVIDVPAAAQIASRLLYVDKATSIASKDLPKPPKARAIAKHKRRIERQPRTPPSRRHDQARHACQEPNCTVSVARVSDLERHLLAVHGKSDKYYQCLGLNCPYQTRRKDKMQEHCRKMHQHLRGSERFCIVQDEGNQIGLDSPPA